MKENSKENPAISYKRKYLVLVIEDNVSNLNYLLFLLKRLNLGFIAATSVKEAVKLLANNQVDCILLDIHLGSSMSGLDLMERWMKQGSFINTPIIAITAYYRGGLHKELLEKGFTDYLSKPYTIMQLGDILNKNGINVNGRQE